MPSTTSSHRLLRPILGALLSGIVANNCFAEIELRPIAVGTVSDSGGVLTNAVRATREFGFDTYGVLEFDLGPLHYPAQRAILSLRFDRFVWSGTPEGAPVAVGADYAQGDGLVTATDVPSFTGWREHPFFVWSTTAPALLDATTALNEARAQGWGYLSVRLQASTTTLENPPSRPNRAEAFLGDLFDHFALIVDPDTCPSDLNDDGAVDLSDLAILLAHFGSTNATPTQGDVNRDQQVDLADLATLLADFGSPCS